MTRRSFFSILLTLVMVLLLVAAGGGYWLWINNPLALLGGSKTASPTAAMFIPKQAPLVASVLVNPDRLEAFRQLIANPSERRYTRSEAEQIKQSLLAKTGLDYTQDIQPWIGDEITVAVTTPDVDRDRGNGQQPGYLLAVATKDAERARQFLQLYWQKQAIAGLDLVFQPYKGVKLIYAQQPDPIVDRPDSSAGRSGSRVMTKSGDAAERDDTAPLFTFTTAVVADRFVLFANSPKVLRDAINNVQASELNLTSSRSYQQAIRSLTPKRIALTYANLGQLSQWLGGQSAAKSGVKSSPKAAGAKPGTTSQGMTQVYDSVAIALGLDRQGLLADTALLGAAGQVLPATKALLTEPPGTLAYLPASLPFTATGRDLRQIWAAVDQGVAAYPPLAQWVSRPIDRLNQQWGVNLAKDIFSWVSSDYAVALLPPAEATPDRNPAKPSGFSTSDWVFLVQRTPSTTAAIAQLDQLASRKGYSVGPVTLGQQTLTAWTELTPAKATKPTAKAGRKPLPASPSPVGDALALTAQVQGLHTTLGQYELFATSINAINQVMRAVDGDTLATSTEFNHAIAPLNPANNGYFYIDWLRFKPVLEDRLPIIKFVELAGQPFFNHLRSLTVSSYGSEAGLRRGAIFFRLT